MHKGKQHKLGPLAQIPPGEGRVFEAGGIRVAVFHDRTGRIYATDPNCPHADGPLADGIVGGGTVICPLHERIYDLETGNSTNADCSIKVYSVSLTDNGDMLLSL